MASNIIDQSNAQAGGDIVGRDKNVYEAPPTPKGVEALLLKLAEQVENNQEVAELIEELSYYHLSLIHI